MTRFLGILFISILPLITTAQEYNYVQYDTKDGLAGSTVYDMCQDREGFMWFATENGLSRYDGTSFKNFTVKDGLSDNEVLKIFPDSKGRIWIGTFSKDICFYYQGKIYNKANCNWLKKLELSSAPLSFVENKFGEIGISDYKLIRQVNPDNSVMNLSELPVFKNYKDEKKIAGINFFVKGFVIEMSDSIFKLEQNKLIFFQKVTDKSDKYTDTKYDSSGKTIGLYLPATRISQFTYLNTIPYVGTTDGAWDIDANTNKLNHHFLPGKKVSRCIKDNEDNLWFSTLGQGVFKLPSMAIENIAYGVDKSVKDKEIYSLSGNGQEVYAGLGYSKVAFIRQGRANKVIDFSKYLSGSSNNSSRNILHSSYALSNGEAMLGFDAFLLKFGKIENKVINIVAIKSICEINEDEILVGAFDYTYRINTDKFLIIDTVYSGRSTKVFNYGNDYYIGTLDGLRRVDKTTRQVFHLGSLNIALTRRINDIKTDNYGVLWIATNDAGIVGIKDNKVVIAINDSMGLSSNICKSLFIKNDFLYVGTNKGLNKISVTDFNTPIIKYSVGDGLPSDIINALYVTDSLIYIGSPRGLSYFNEQKLSEVNICNFKLLSIKSGGIELPRSSTYKLAYKNNNIRFDYVAISFKSGGDITYHYTLDGLDPSWHPTNKTALEYLALPPGKYTLKIYAVNKFGKRSETYAAAFTIATPFYRSWWFFTIIFLLIFGMISAFFYFRNKRMQAEFIEKNNVEKLLASLEQQALQSQMNPHFIFNCLNSIQQFILTNDKEKTNLYLTGFASLIRKTLNISAQKNVTVEEEVAYLKNYLEMEKMRFGDSFEYEINGYENDNISQITLPALFLQPYVENALRHGIRYKTDGSGKVTIKFHLSDNKLICNITDNGIGRARAGAYKSPIHMEYQSRGMSLTAKRMELLNKMYDQQINCEVIVLVDTEGNGVGTEVTIKISL